MAVEVPCPAAQRPVPSKTAAEINILEKNPEKSICKSKVYFWLSEKNLLRATTWGIAHLRDALQINWRKR